MWLIINNNQGSFPIMMNERDFKIGRGVNFQVHPKGWGFRRTTKEAV